MKAFSTLVLLLMTVFSLQGQNLSRVLIEGQIIVPRGDDPEGVVIYNRSSGRGTITDLRGEFLLAAGQNDTIIVQSIQFNPVTMMVDRGVVRSGSLVITLRESVEELDEILVTPYDLTGNVQADVNRIPVVDKIDFVASSEIRIEDSQYDAARTVDNVAIDDQTWRYGINFVNIFKALVGKRSKDAERFEETAEQELARLYDNAFFKSNLNIKEENIGKFLDYVAANGLNKQMLERGNELNLVQFLVNKRDDFREEMDR